VGRNTGTINLSIPIHTVMEAGLRLPISVDYHTGGIRAGEIASQVGLGWSLRAGGVISRTVNGKADEYGGFAIYDLKSDPFEYVPTQAINGFMSPEMRRVYDGRLDAEPDLFSFNLGQISGHFVIDYSHRKVQIFPHQDLKIEYQIKPQGGFEFTLTDTDGTRYTFGEGNAEDWVQMKGSFSTGSIYDQKNNEPRPTAWYLTRVESADRKHQIRLEYKTISYQYATLAGKSLSIQYGCTRDGGFHAHVQPTPRFSERGREHPSGKKVNWQQVKGAQIVAIYSSTETISFKQEENRLDIDPFQEDGHGIYPGNRALTTIEIDNGLNRKAFDLTYDYFIDPDFRDEWGSGGRRLRLTQIREHSLSDPEQSLPPYRFEYHSIRQNPDGTPWFPNRLTKAIDHWGYYNGAEENEQARFNTPSFRSNYSIAPLQFGDGNRETNPDYTQLGLLKKVTYPLGGSRTFSYESHDGARTSYLEEEEEFAFLSAEFNPSNCPVAAFCCPTFLDSVDYDTLSLFLSKAELTGASLEFWLEELKLNECSGPGYSTYHSDERAVLQITGENGFSRKVEININSLVDPLQGVQIPFFNIGLTEPGFYSFRLTAFGQSRAEVKLFKVVSREEQINSFVGGARIKSIYTFDGKKGFTRSFHYNYFDKPESSGQSRLSQRYHTVIRAEAEVGIRSNGQPQGAGLSKIEMTYAEERPIIPHSVIDGKHISYLNVTESEIDDAGNSKGKTEYTFSYVRPYTLSFFNVPDPRIGDRLLFSKRMYDEGGQLVAFDSIAYQETSWIPFTPEGEYYYLFRVPNQCNYGESNSRTPVYKDFSSFLRTKTYLKKKEINFRDGVKSTIRYDYPSDFTHLYPVKILSFNSDGTEHKKEMQYAHEILQEKGEEIYSELINRNMTSVPLQTLESAGGQYISGSQVAYAFFDPNTGEPDSVPTSEALPGPFQFFNYEADSSFQEGSFELIRTILAIDPQTGFPARVKQKGWEPEYWDWDPESLVLRSKAYGAFRTRFEYFEGSRLLRKKIDIDGQETEYTYDGLNRLSSIITKKGNVVESFRYVLGGGAEGANYLESRTTFQKREGSDLVERTVRSYWDGLGKTVQAIQLGGGTGGRDVVRAIEYDGFGRKIRLYKPVPGGVGTGEYVTVGPDSPHTFITYESSPLSRPVSSTPPGWYPTQMAYETNTEELPTGRTRFPSQSLFKEISTDPEGVKTISYRDKLGRMILVSKVQGGDVSRTQFTYDLKGRLSKVIPPGANLDNKGLLFEYKYDRRDNVIQKKLPDQDAVHQYLYDKRNLMTYQQDPYQAIKGYWIHHQYDIYGRKTASRKVRLNNKPTSEAIHDEGFLLTSYQYDGERQEEVGKLVESEISLLDGSGVISTRYKYDLYGRLVQELGNHHLYLESPDSRRIRYQYDWAGNELSVFKEMEFPELGLTRWQERTEYDAMGRPNAHFFTPQQEEEKQLSALAYTLEGEIRSKRVGREAEKWLQKIDYQYLPNGFLASINGDAFHQTESSALALNPKVQPPGLEPVNNLVPEELDLFSLRLHYDQPDAPGSQGLKNGNISQLDWQVAGRSMQAGWFEYDFLGRLTQSQTGQQHRHGEPFFDDNLFHTAYAYDPRGNITYLERSGLYWDPSDRRYVQGVVDQLTYAYAEGTNRITTIEDLATDTLAAREGFSIKGQDEKYIYDANGNVIYDPSRDVSIDYNFLNLPQRIVRGDGKELYMLYDAEGRKVSQWVRSCGTNLEGSIADIDQTEDGKDRLQPGPSMHVESDNEPPLAYFLPFLAPDSVPEFLTLDAGASTDSDGYIEEYYWDLGDGQVARGQTISHTYEMPGKYRITLVVLDDQGAQSSYSKVVHLTGDLPADLDGDGYTADEDCLDSDSRIFPGAPEYCDGIDNDCDGEIDEGEPTDLHILEEACLNLAQYRITLRLEGDYLLDVEDADYWAPLLDGRVMIIMPARIPATLNLIHDSGCMTHYTIAPPDCMTQDWDQDGYVLAEDCDDWNPRINPGMTEYCFDNLDNNCNQEVDEIPYQVDLDATRGDHPDWGREVYDQRRDYLEGLEFLNGELEAAYLKEGRLYYFAPDSSRYEWALKDHLGNIRVTFTDKNGNGRVDLDGDPEKSEILQENHYYPYGMRMNGPWMESRIVNRYQYNGKEKIEELELGWYDYGARGYDPAIARWGQVDPLAEEMAGWSPFNYVLGNPILLNDPFGLLPESPDWIYDQQEDGSYVRREGVENDGGESFHTFINNDGTVTYVNTTDGTSATVNQDEVSQQVAEPEPVVVHQLGLTASLGAPIGITLGGGLAWDSNGGLNPYGSAGFFHGVEITAGVEYTQSRSKSNSEKEGFGIDSIEGTGVNLNAGILYVDGGFGNDTQGNGNFGKDQQPTYNFYSVGLSVGIPIGLSRTVENTKVFKLFNKKP